MKFIVICSVKIPASMQACFWPFILSIFTYPLSSIVLLPLHTWVFIPNSVGWHACWKPDSDTGTCVSDSPNVTYPRFPLPHESDLVALSVASMHTVLIIPWEAEQRHFGSVSEARLLEFFLKIIIDCLASGNTVREFVSTHFFFCLFPKFWELSLSKVLPVTMPVTIASTPPCFPYLKMSDSSQWFVAPWLIFWESYFFYSLEKLPTKMFRFLGII